MNVEGMTDRRQGKGGAAIHQGGEAAPALKIYFATSEQDLSSGLKACCAGIVASSFR
jgi:hypothetical protein